MSRVITLQDLREGDNLITEKLYNDKIKKYKSLCESLAVELKKSKISNVKNNIVIDEMKKEIIKLSKEIEELKNPKLPKIKIISENNLDDNLFSRMNALITDTGLVQADIEKMRQDARKQIDELYKKY